MMTSNQIDAALAAVIRGRVAMAQIRQADLAVKVGMSQATLTRALAGTKSLSVSQLYIFAQALDMQVPDLWDEARSYMER